MLWRPFSLLQLLSDKFVATFHLNIRLPLQCCCGLTSRGSGRCWCCLVLGTAGTWQGHSLGDTQTLRPGKDIKRKGTKNDGWRNGDWKGVNMQKRQAESWVSEWVRERLGEWTCESFNDSIKMTEYFGTACKVFLALPVLAVAGSQIVHHHCSSQSN